MQWRYALPLLLFFTPNVSLGECPTDQTLCEQASLEEVQHTFEGSPIPERFQLKPPSLPPGNAHANYLMAVAMPNGLYGLSSAGQSVHDVSARKKFWASITPNVQVTDDGIYVSISGGQTIALPPELENDPVRVAQLHQDFKPSGYHTAFIMGGTSMLTGALLEATGVVSTPEPWYIDLLLNGGSGFALGCSFNEGPLSRDIAQGALNGATGWGFSLASSAIFHKPAPDPRYATISYGFIYGLKGALPQNGNPIFTNGTTGNNWLTNATTDIIFAGLWDGAAGYLGQSMRGDFKSKDFLIDLASGAFFKGLQNAYYGTRIELDPAVLSQAEHLSLARAGADTSRLVDDMEIRRGGLYFMLNPDDPGIARTWVSIQNPYALGNLTNRSGLTLAGEKTAEILAHQYVYLWEADRIGLQMGLWETFQDLSGADENGDIYEELPNEVSSEN